MSPIDDPKAQTQSTAWNPLGQLELSLDSGAEASLKTWLEELLTPLRLHADLHNNILNSSIDSVQQARQLNAEMRPGHMHVSVLISDDHDSTGTMWGFFRIEKTDHPGEEKEYPDHALEFYLYREGR